MRESIESHYIETTNQNFIRKKQFNWTSYYTKMEIHTVRIEKNIIDFILEKESRH